MKSFNLLLLVSFLCLDLTMSAQTGILDRSKDRATDKANNRADSRIDKKMDEGMDAIEGLFKKKSKKEDVKNDSKNETESSEVEEVNEVSEPSTGNGMFSGMFEAAKWNESYSFDLVSEVRMTSTSRKGKVEESDMIMRVGKDCMAMTVSDPEKKDIPPTVIFDYENFSMITLMEDKGEKSGVAMAMNQEQIAKMTEETIDEEIGDAVITKTGKTKSILGHICHQYTFKSEDSTGEMWMAEDVELAMDDIFGIMTISNKKTKLPENYPEGYLMETTSTDLDKGDVIHYLVTSLEENANEKVSTSNYNVMDPMGMMKSGKN